MTKERYIDLRKSGNAMALLFEEYNEHDKAYLGFMEFSALLPMYNNIGILYQDIVSKYNKLYDIVEVYNKDGVLVKII